VSGADLQIPRSLRLGMPQLDAGGLSESWLLRYAGDLHWEVISRRLEAASDQIQGEDGQRLYPTFVAVRARYEVPLAAARENDRLDASIEVVPCGRACAHSRFVAALAGRRFELELLSTFAAQDGQGGLKMALPAARLAARWNAVEDQPPIARLARAARRGEPLVDDFCGPRLDTGQPPLGGRRLEPSPYAHYNGARLLYFASYVTIADDVERQLVHALDLVPARRRSDWALGTSTVRRDVFYHANLPLGHEVAVELLSCETDREGVRTRVRLRRADDGTRMADVVTRRRFVERP
jgi:probable biosynthetic protein (TIGR04098 family)